MARLPGSIRAEMHRLGLSVARRPECSTCGMVHTGRCAPKHYKAQIVDEIARLEFEQFRHPSDPDERARLLETRELARAQLADDVYTISGARRDRIGGEWVLTRDTSRGDQDVYELWPQRTEEDDALALALEPILDRLSPEERALTRLRFDADESVSEIGGRFGTSRQNINQRLGRIYAKLKQMLLNEFSTDPEVIDI